ncbi:MAG: hypothetical protein R3B93_21525 [Bacteroidia bacterium]
MKIFITLVMPAPTGKGQRAILMYDKAIEKGLDRDYIYLFKGLAQKI